MKTSEVLRKYRDELIESAMNLYRLVLEYEGRIKYLLYIWDDGEIEVLEDVCGGNSFLRANSGESRSLHYVDTFSIPPGYLYGVDMDGDWIDIEVRAFVNTVDEWMDDLIKWNEWLEAEDEYRGGV